MEIITIKKMMYSMITLLKNIKIIATKVETYITTLVMDYQTINTTKKYKNLYKTKKNSSNSIQVWQVLEDTLTSLNKKRISICYLLHLAYLLTLIRFYQTATGSIFLKDRLHLS